jgi:hypothetical protein
MIKIELTVEQANHVIKLVEDSIKNGGYPNAKASVILIDIILDAGKAAGIPEQQQQESAN